MGNCFSPCNMDECMNHDDIVIPGLIPGLRKLNAEIPGLKIVPGLESLPRSQKTIAGCTDNLLFNIHY